MRLLRTMVLAASTLVACGGTSGGSEESYAFYRMMAFELADRE